jgi:DNA uptake protein ComE-like DNA-binding protein
VNTRGSGSNRRGSAFIIVLWVSLGLISLTIYFAYSMMYELRAGSNRVEGLAAEQAIDGAARYLSCMLYNLETNGLVPDPANYAHEAVSLASRTQGADVNGSPRFWLIGRDTNAEPTGDTLTFALVDEASRVNLNTAPSNMLYHLPWMTEELTTAILDWRGTNGPGTTYTYYGMQTPAYECKQAPFESPDELRLLMGAELEMLQGEDLNFNGVLDPDEEDTDNNGQLDCGLLEYVTVFSREPNTYSNGVARVNITTLSSSSQEFSALLDEYLAQGRRDAVMQTLNISGGGGGGGGGGRPGGQPGGQPGGGGTTAVTFASLLDFYRRSGLTAEEFVLIADKLTLTNASYIEGRININTASAAVLSCLPGLIDSPDLVRTMIEYRNSNPDKLGSVAWLVEALGSNNSSALDELQATDCITTQSYQFTADIAAVGAHGRGYRRLRVILDTSTGTPRVIYRRDMTGLGWALGKTLRQELLSPNYNLNDRIAAK